MKKLPTTTPEGDLFVSRLEIICENCNADFLPKRKDQKHCSFKCRKQAASKKYHAKELAREAADPEKKSAALEAGRVFNGRYIRSHPGMKALLRDQALDQQNPRRRKADRCSGSTTLIAAARLLSKEGKRSKDPAERKALLDAATILLVRGGALLVAEVREKRGGSLTEGEPKQ